MHHLRAFFSPDWRLCESPFTGFYVIFSELTLVSKSLKTQAKIAYVSQALVKLFLFRIESTNDMFQKFETKLKAYLEGI